MIEVLDVIIYWLALDGESFHCGCIIAIATVVPVDLILLFERHGHILPVELSISHRVPDNVDTVPLVDFFALRVRYEHQEARVKDL